jgi:hypothetical protein
VSGTEGYAAEAEALVAQYESLSFADVRRPVRHLFPTAPCGVVDIGAGTGRDAAGFTALGHRVVAVEPTAELRTRAASLMRPGGAMILSLRYGPVPPGRRMFGVSAEETVLLAAREGLRLMLKVEAHADGLGRAGVRWTRLAFAKTDTPT